MLFIAIVLLSMYAVVGVRRPSKVRVQLLATCDSSKGVERSSVARVDPPRAAQKTGTKTSLAVHHVRMLAW